MRERTVAAHRSPSPPRSACTVDVVVFTPRDGRLVVLALAVDRPRAREKLHLPWQGLRVTEPLAGAARRLARAHLGADPAWLEQVGAFADGARHPSGAALSVCFAAVVPVGGPEPVQPAAWVDAGDVGALPERQRAMVSAAQQVLRNRMDYEPVPFRLLPALFTLSELQEIYELLLGRRLHKASFRRALHAAWLVEPTDQWRGEGRGRPAQLFRYAPRKRRGHRRAVRFDLL
jgi:8-oxo-dGTP diphosphatase